MFAEFDRIYCIHLPNAGRRKFMDEQFARLGIIATYVYAKADMGYKVSNMRRNSGAEFGANLSHIKAIVTALNDGAKRPLFLEDDVLLRPSFEQVGQMVDRDFDVLYLGGHPREKVTMVSEHLARVKTFSCAEAYSVRGPLLGDLHGFWCDRITKPNAMFDFILGEFASAHDSYSVYPVVTEQAPFVSHIKGEIDDKRQLIAKGWANNLC